MQNQWDERYAGNEYVYGTEPNSFLKEKISKLEPGKILFPAEGEGRNAVYAATIGWKADAFDQSTEARKKALNLAREKGVEITYQIQSLETWNPKPEQYDCIALIFVHLPASLRTKVHLMAAKALKPGGFLILEAFTDKQLNRNSGGPKNIEMLYTPGQMKSDFQNFTSLDISEEQVVLAEGPLHNGPAEVIRVIGEK
jgi:SAM-dependent methyltransferase